MRVLSASDIDETMLFDLIRDLTFVALPGTGKTRYLRTFSEPREMWVAFRETEDLILSAAARSRGVIGVMAPRPQSVAPRAA